MPAGSFGTLSDRIIRETGVPAARVAREVDALVARRLLLLIDGHYLSIALRPRDELVERFHKAPISGAAHTASSPLPERFVVLSNDREMIQDS